MIVENWNKIYGELLGTTKTVYEIGEDTMTVAPHAHVLRLTPVKDSRTPFTVIIAQLENKIKCGIYTDSSSFPVEIFDVSKLDLKSIDTFKHLLSYKIDNHE